MSAPISWQDLIASVRHRLSHVPTEDVMRDLRHLAAHALGVPVGRMTLHLHDQVQPEERARFNLFVDARMLHTPISKIVQRRQFWGRDFSVDLNVLDPRADTETLIEAALALGPQERVLDLGTGSGAIGLTLAAEWVRSDVVCTDISDDALAVARHNMNQIGVADTVTLLRSDWFEHVTGRYDLIASNPPYIALDEWRELAFEVRSFDPRMALTDEGDGLSAYRIITHRAPAYLNPKGHLMVEIGHRQGASVKALFEQAGFTNVKVLQDINGKDRVVMGRGQ